MVVLFVDHEQTSLDEIFAGIADERATSTMKTVGETNDLLQLLIDPEPAATLAERTIARITEEAVLPNLILVDLNFNKRRGDDSIQIGRTLAQAIRMHFSEIAVGVYSKHELSPRDKGLISADRFALRLDEVRKMFEDLNRPMTGDDWNAVFERVLRKSEEESDRLPSILTMEPPKNFTWVDNHPISRSFGFKRAAPNLVAKALRSLDLSPETPVRIAQLSGGFSGSYLVKAEIGEGASFVIKIDEDPERLVRELDGYRKVRTKLDHNYYLTPVSSDHDPVKLTPNWWGAFAVPYETSAKPLLDVFPTEANELADLYNSLWKNCLFSLYGRITTKQVLVKDVMPLKPGKTTADRWSGLSRYSERFSSLGPVRTKTVQRLLSAVENEDRTDFKGTEFEAPWAEEVHGDLNCRNILYNKESRSFRILDFPNVGTNCVAFDFAKAEAELMLIMLDWSTGNDCDFDRIALWESASQMLCERLVPHLKPFPDYEVDRAISGILAIRQLYLERATDHGDTEKAYFMYLCSRVLKYLSYEDITIPKRHFAFLWVAQLWERLFS
jgi:hypothetical protein